MSLLLKECRWCGISFVPTHFNDAYCSGKCKNESIRERQKNARFRDEYRKTRDLENGVPTIPDVVAATMKYKDKTGRLISYGKMVNIMEREGI